MTRTIARSRLGNRFALRRAFVPLLETLEDRTAPSVTGIGGFDPTTATWYLHFGAGPGNPDAGQFQYGGRGWTPVTGDWNGDGKTDVGAVDPNLVWYLHDGAGPGNPDAGQFQYGGRGWTPVTGD